MSRRVHTALARTLLAGISIAFGLAATPPRVAIEQDPTRPPSFGGTPADVPLSPGTVAKPAASSRLTTTVVTPGASFAVIDGVKVEEGDFVSGARVVKIDPEGVILDGGAGRFELRFHAFPVKAVVSAPAGGDQ